MRNYAGMSKVAVRGTLLDCISNPWDCDQEKQALRYIPDGVLVVEDGKIVQNIDIQHGFEQIPDTLKRLFTGENLGKQLLKLSDPPLPLRKNRLEATIFRLLSAYISWRKA